MKQVLQYKSSQIAYYTYGSGGEVVFCFHGYGLAGESFLILEHIFEADYTLICIDFPFHGSTYWQDGLFFSVEDLWEIMNLVNPKPKVPFSLMGYSMGGRIVMQLLQTYPQQIKQVALIAPDGLKLNWWQEVATRTIIGNRLFRYTMRCPQWLFAVIKVSGWLRLIKKSIEKFALAHIDNASERQLLYNRWSAMRAYKPSLDLLRSIIRQYKIPVKLLFGQHDRIITIRQGLAFKKNEPLISVKEINCGHNLLKEQYAKVVRKLLDKKP